MVEPTTLTIARQSLPDTLHAALRERILSGEFAEGAPLVQDAIALEYGVSRIPVREALRQLEALGLVTIKTHHGAVVAGVPTEQVAELFDVRAALEPDLLRRAVERVTDQDIASAKAILNALERSYVDRDPAEWGRLNWMFHRRLYEPSGRIRTIVLLDGINLQLERYLRLHLTLVGGFEEARQEHREMLRLCSARDADRAAALLRDHILDTSKALVSELSLRRLNDQTI